MRLLFIVLILVSRLHAGDWPQFLGPQRNATAEDENAITGEAEPETLWQHELGSGHAGPVVSAGRVIVFHRQGADMVTESLDAADGKPIWRHAYPATYRDSFGFDDGPRAVPCISGGKVVTHGPEGIVQALDFATGKLVWEFDTVAEVDSPQGYFGRACSPLVVDGKVLLNVGGVDGAGVIALDLESGRPVWKADDEEAGYSSPVVVPEDPAVSAFFTRKGVLMVRNADGRVLADERFRATIDASVNAAAPVPCGDGRLLFSAAYDVGAGLWQWNSATGKLAKLWQKHDVLDCHYTTPVYHGGYVYGLHGRQETGMRPRCVAVDDGTVTWEASERIQGGTLILVGDKLLMHAESGELWVFNANPDKFELIRRSQITRAGHRSHAAYANGILYARDAEKMVAVRMR
ncbi:MAG: PQQ-binding-like beta-propeller repeat protein [Prosthecobacter sp.]